MSNRVCVHIVTRDRVEYLQCALASLLAQTYLDWDLVLVDASAIAAIDCEAVARLLALTKRLRHNLLYVRDVPAEGIAQAYQKALDASSSELCFRGEDDLWYEPEMLSLLVQTINSHDDVGAVAPMTPNWMFSKVVEPPEQLSNGFRRCVVNGEAILEPVDQQSALLVKQDRVYNVCVLHAGSLYRTSAARKVGGFSTQFSPIGHREETHFYLRMYYGGWRLQVRTGARSWHFEGSLGGSRTKGADDLQRQEYRAMDEQRFQADLACWTKRYPDKPITMVEA